MTSLSNGIVIAAIFLSYGLLATAKEVHHVGGSGGGLRRKRNFKKMNKLERKMETKQKNTNSIMEDEEDAFSKVRLLGKESLQSMPTQIDRPPIRRLGKGANSIMEDEEDAFS